MQLTPNFNSVEFACHDGSQVPEKLMPNLKVLAQNLQVLRNELGCSISITSGYRSPAHNKAVGGKSKSYHMEAMAADIVSRKHTPAQLRVIIERLISQGKMKQGGLGAYKTFTHYDVRGVKARWKG